MTEQPQIDQSAHAYSPLLKIAEPVPVNRSMEINELAAALAKAQGQLFAAAKDAENPFLHNHYASLASVLATCREPLSLNGLAVVQMPGGKGTDRHVDTVLMHSSGQWISSRLCMTPGYVPKGGKFTPSDDPQSIGSSISYSRRYALMAIIGMAAEDDDGEDATRGIRPMTESATRMRSLEEIESQLFNLRASVTTENAQQVASQIQELNEEYARVSEQQGGDAQCRETTNQEVDSTSRPSNAAPTSNPEGAAKPVETEVLPPDWREYKIQYVSNKAYFGKKLSELSKEEIEILWTKRGTKNLQSNNTGERIEAKMLHAAMEAL